jgi:DNA modification methylase
MQVNRIIQGDCLEIMSTFPDCFVDLIVTSPPYNAGKEYENILTEKEYCDFINPIVAEMSRVLKTDGRFAINVVFNINRVEQEGKSVLFPFLSWIDAIRENKLNLKENIIWDQQNSGCETAWGSWKSASAPHIRHMTENILIGYKNQWNKIKKGLSDLTTSEFMKYTLDKWRFSCETNRFHPAPFPEELAKRCVKLLSFMGDVVLDPFCGAGTTCVVAKKFGRRYIGIDLNRKYCDRAIKRVTNVAVKLERFFEAPPTNQLIAVQKRVER